MRDMLETLIWLMDKGEGLEQKSNDWESARRKHIDLGHIRKFWGRLCKKWKGNGKERKCLSILREARQFSIEKRQQMPKVNTRKIDVVSRIEPLMSSKLD